jgi:hypothetical protein
MRFFYFFLLGCEIILLIYLRKDSTRRLNLLIVYKGFLIENLFLWS